MVTLKSFAFGCVVALTVCAQDPACEIGMVVKAGALNYNAKILEFNAASGLYKVQYVTGSKGDVAFVPPSGLKTCLAPPIAPVPLSWFQGVWQSYKGGGGAWAKNPNSGSWKVVALDAAAGPPIRMNADGTFEWIINQSQTIRGRWRGRAKRVEVRLCEPVQLQVVRRQERDGRFVGKGRARHELAGYASTDRHRRRTRWNSA